MTAKLNRRAICVHAGGRCPKQFQNGECARTERTQSQFRTVRNDELRTNNAAPTNQQRRPYVDSFKCSGNTA